MDIISHVIEYINIKSASLPLINGVLVAFIAIFAYKYIDFIIKTIIFSIIFCATLITMMNYYTNGSLTDLYNLIFQKQKKWWIF